MPKRRKPIPADPDRVDISNYDELRYWCLKWNRTALQVHAAVKLVGSNVKDVKRALGIH